METKELNKETKLLKFNSIVKQIADTICTDKDEGSYAGGVIKTMNRAMEGTNPKIKRAFKDFHKVQIKSDGTTGKITPLEYFISKKDENIYSSCIYDNAYVDRTTSSSDVNQIFLEHYDDSYKSRKEILNKIKSNRKLSLSYVFWLIFLVTIDNEDFNEKLNVVSDVAYILNIDNDMIEDCTVVIKTILSGKDLSNINYKSAFAKECLEVIKID